MNNMRRKICQSLGALFGATSLVACAQHEVKKPERSYSEEEQQRMHKFRGIGGYETVISGFGSSLETGIFVVLSNDRGQVFEEGTFWEKKDSKSSFGIYPPGLMKTLTAKAYTKRGGQAFYEITIPVADRIPDELLDDLRRDPRGMLRIKIRLHREDVLLGWDIERRPNPWQLPQEEWFAGGVSRVPQPAWTHTGGDFKEARSAEYVWEGSGFKGLPANIPPYSPEIRWKRPWRHDNLIAMPSAESLGGVVPKQWAEQGLYIANVKDHLGNYRGVLKEKGWYIHPKTGQRIETDF
jgi:hypothetical protein